MDQPDDMCLRRLGGCLAILTSACARSQMGKRKFQLTIEQPVDECLALLGDCLVADLEARAVEPIVTICRMITTELSARLGPHQTLPHPVLAAASPPHRHHHHLLYRHH